MTPDELRDRIAAALQEAERRPQIEADPDAIIETRHWGREADAVLPVVREVVADVWEEGRAASDRDANPYRAAPWRTAP